MKLISEFWKEEDAVGVVEVILILVVLIGLVLIFKKQLVSLVNSLMEKVTNQSNTVSFAYLCLGISFIRSTASKVRKSKSKVEGAVSHEGNRKTEKMGSRKHNSIFVSRSDTDAFPDFRDNCVGAKCPCTGDDGLRNGTGTVFSVCRV